MILSYIIRCSDCVSMGSMGSVEPMDFESLVPEPMDFEGGFHKIWRLFGFHIVMQENCKQNPYVTKYKVSFTQIEIRLCICFVSGTLWRRGDYCARLLAATTGRDSALVPAGLLLFINSNWSRFQRWAKWGTYCKILGGVTGVLDPEKFFGTHGFKVLTQSLWGIIYPCISCGI